MEKHLFPCNVHSVSCNWGHTSPLDCSGVTLSAPCHGAKTRRVQLKKQFSPLAPFPFLVLPVLSLPGADLQVTAGHIFPMNLAIWSKASPPLVFCASRFPQHRWSVGEGELWPSGPDPSPALAQREHRPLWRRPREDHHLRLRGRGLLRQPPHPLTPLRGYWRQFCLFSWY